MRRRGFTLIELLVVIAIIAVLAAILFPVFASARQSAYKSTCQNNLKQIHQAITQYLADYDQKYPTAAPAGRAVDDCASMRVRGNFGGWVGNLLLTYTKNSDIYMCPATKEKSSVVNNFGEADGSGGCGFPRGSNTAPYRNVSYAYNYVTLWNKMETELDRPGDLAMMWDSTTAWADRPYMDVQGVWATRDVPVYMVKKGMPLVAGMNDPRTVLNGDYWRVKFREAPHSGDTTTFLFGDGHVKTTSWDRLQWGNLNGFIDANHPDFRASLTTRPIKDWPGMLDE